MFQAAADAFAQAVETSAEHVVEVNPYDAAQFREQVRTLAARIEDAPKSGPVNLGELQAARDVYRSELRAYAEKAGRDVRRLREELHAAVAAMQSIAEGISDRGVEHDLTLKRELTGLQQALDAEDAAIEAVRRIRTRACQTIGAVMESYEELKQTHALVVTQLRDEIRVLQQELARSQAKTECAPASAAKLQFNEGVERLLRQDHDFGAVLLFAPDAKDLARRYPQAHVDRALADLLQSFAKLAQMQPVQHSGAVYAVLQLTSTGPDLETWRQQLSACHVFQHEGIPRTLQIEVRLAWVEHRKGESPAIFFDRLAAHAGKA